jgi:hypothetical protein
MAIGVDGWNLVEKALHQPTQDPSLESVQAFAARYALEGGTIDEEIAISILLLFHFLGFFLRCRLGCILLAQVFI